MTRLQDQRVWIAAGAVGAVFIIAVGWVLFAGPKLSSVGDLRDETVATRESNDILMADTAVLRAKSKRVDRYTASLQTALAALPYDSGLPAFTRQLDAQGRSVGVTISSVVVSGASAVESAQEATDDATASATGPTAAGGVFAMQVTVQSEGSLTGQLAFLRAVQGVGPRRALITATQVSPGSASSKGSIDRRATFSTQLTVFSAPRTPAQVRQLDKLVRGDLER